MRTQIYKIILIGFLSAIPVMVSALDTSQEEKACRDIGFTKKNPDFGECVIELVDRRFEAQAKLDAKAKLDAQAKATATKPSQDVQVSYRSSPAREGSNSVWDLRRMASLNIAGSYLTRPDHTTYDTIKVADARVLVSVVDKIGNSAGLRPTLFVRESSQINAAANFDKNGNPVIYINKPMLDLIKNDQDMAAALIGHEMAHLHLNHPGATSTTDTIGTIFGVLAGVALEVVAQKKLGVTNLGLNAGTLAGAAFSTSFTRDQEREADRLGIIWAKQNGYDPMGAVRLFQVLERQGGNNLIPFFQTHPNPSERIENARQAAQ